MAISLGTEQFGRVTDSDVVQATMGQDVNLGAATYMIVFFVLF